MALGLKWLKSETGDTRKFARYLLLAVPIFITVKTCIVDLTYINGTSMSPLLNSFPDQSRNKDLCLNLRFFENWKFFPHSSGTKHLRHGMVVTLRNPYDPESFQVKRIVALQGEVVNTLPPCPYPTMKVPPGHVWVEGDAGEGKSLDSNTYGPVSAHMLTGHLTHILWPRSKAGRIQWWNHEGTFWSHRERRHS